MGVSVSRNRNLNYKRFHRAINSNNRIFTPRSEPPWLVAGQSLDKVDIGEDGKEPKNKKNYAEERRVSATAYMLTRQRPPDPKLRSTFFSKSIVPDG